MEYFIAARTKIFVGREKELNGLKDFAKNGSGYLMLTASAGSGKSALMAKLCADFSDALLLNHFVGASAKSTNVLYLLDRLCQALMAEGANVEDYEVDYYKLTQAFAELIKQAAEKKPVVIVIDAVNQLLPEYGAHELNWLPKELPDNVKIIISTLPGTSEQALGNKLKAQVQKVNLLDGTETRQIIHDYLQQYDKTLDEDSTRALLDKQESSNPLYLKVALEESRTLGGDQIYLKIKELIKQLPSDVPGLFKGMFKRLEQSFGQELLQKLLCSIAISRGGMLQSELMVILRSQAQLEEFSNYDNIYESFRYGIKAYTTEENSENDKELCWLVLKAGKLSHTAQQDVDIAFTWVKQGKLRKALKRLQVLEGEAFYKAVLLLLWIEAKRREKAPIKDVSDVDFIVEELDKKIAQGASHIDWAKFLDRSFMMWWHIE